jgi:hypothetical protein
MVFNFIFFNSIYKEEQAQGGGAKSSNLSTFVEERKT